MFYKVVLRSKIYKNLSSYQTSFDFVCKVSENVQIVLIPCKFNTTAEKYQTLNKPPCKPRQRALGPDVIRERLTSQFGFYQNHFRLRTPKRFHRAHTIRQEKQHWVCHRRILCTDVFPLSQQLEQNKTGERNRTKKKRKTTLNCLLFRLAGT